MQQSGQFDLQIMLGEAYYLFVITTFIFWAYNIICNWLIFVKAKHEGWESIVPIYNIYVFFNIIGVSLWNLLWLFLPIVGTIVLIIKMVGSLSRSFGKSTGFALGLLFMGPIFHGILAFSSSIEYVGPNGIAIDNQSNKTLDGDI